MTFHDALAMVLHAAESNAGKSTELEAACRVVSQHLEHGKLGAKESQYGDLLYSQRKAITEGAVRWCIETGVGPSPFNMVTAICAVGYTITKKQ